MTQAITQTEPPRSPSRAREALQPDSNRTCPRQRHHLKSLSRSHCREKKPRVGARVREQQASRQQRDEASARPLATQALGKSEVLQTGLSVQVTMRDRIQRIRSVSTPDVKPYHLRPLTLRHSLADECAQYAWGLGFKLPLEAVKTSSLDSRVSCRRTKFNQGNSRRS